MSRTAEDKRVETIANAFAIQILRRNQIVKQIKICVDKVNEFCNRFLNTWWKDENIKIYSTHNERTR